MPPFHWVAGTHSSPLLHLPPLRLVCYLSSSLYQLLMQLQRQSISTPSLPGADVSFISTPRLYIHPSPVLPGLMEREVRGGRRWVGSVVKRDYSLSSSPQALQTCCCNAVTVRGWVVLAFTMNYQWIVCALMCHLLMGSRLSILDTIFSSVWPSWDCLMMQCDAWADLYKWKCVCVCVCEEYIWRIYRGFCIHFSHME